MSTLGAIWDFMVILAVGLIVPALLIKAPFDWLALALMFYCRRRFVLWRLACVFAGLWVGVALLITMLNAFQASGVNEALCGFLFALFFAPGIAKFWATRAAWAAEPKEDVREHRARIRNRMLEREGSRRRVSKDKCWRQYIRDAEWARREDAYRLPGDRLQG